MDDFEFSGIADAVNLHGFFAIAKKALEFIAAHFHCTCTVNPDQIVEARNSWVILGHPLPLEVYNFKKRDLVIVAVLIQAVSYCDIAKFIPDKDTISPLLTDYPNEVLALVMGLILHDIALRTAGSGVGGNHPARINFLHIGLIDGPGLRNAVRSMRNKATRNHRRRFAELLRILTHFKN
ncbi:hypothetical protein [Rhizobium laguerreae]|uniref:hypothetical protein n=1 Tax=Rhizobium laguerreae TaxID=1076926 RepID=UPI001C92960D|nr:hypothetical protein [Rhizobium laguerreae]MBY3378926.1 hypothetical protein [Rhizobium laguerreae]